MTKRKVRLPPFVGTVSRREVESVVKAVHVAPEEGEWVVLKVGPRRIHQSFGTRAEAVSYAQEILAEQPTEVILHEGNGTVIRGPSDCLVELASCT